MEGKINGCDSFRDASFSYLRSDQKPTATGARTSKSTAGEAGEISVFGAERYFNTPIQTLHANPDRRQDSQGGAGEDIADDGVSVATVRPGTPSACSDGSRSTVTLLKSGSAAQRPHSHHRRRRRRQWLLEGSRSFFSNLGCTGTCTDEKSVFVADQKNREDRHQHRQENHEYRYEARSTKRSEDHFAFPILNSSGEEGKKLPLPSAVTAEDDPPRMSLEVFGSKEALGVVDEVAKHLERKLSVLTWDAIPASVPPKPYIGGSRVSPKKTSRGGDDIDSDASSDLFEIENITAHRRAYETAAVVSARNSGYEPSEASIDWSVVTADVAGSELYDEKKISAKAAKRRPVIGMLGCKTQKSVRVARTSVSSKEEDS